ncbi:hypothetical protein PJL18_03149 [Paenarthrobacter nicotinovorans]|nr:hypothetical protein [Paenarthrobacter nicotinovorans]
MCDSTACADDAPDLCFALKFVVARKDGLTLAEKLLVGAEVGVAALLALGISLCALALFKHERAEACLINLEAGFFGHFQGQVDREAVGVVQREGIGAGQRNSCSFRFGHSVFQAGRSRSNGAEEGLLLGVSNAADAREVGFHHRVNALHGVAGGGKKVRKACLLDTEETHGAHSPADEAAQHVATAFVGRRHTIGNEHQGGPDVVRDDAHADVIGVVRVLRRLGRGVLAAGQFGSFVDDRADLVGLVHVLDALEDHRQALHAQAGVDVLLRQLADDIEVHLGTDVFDLVLHEHKVPDFDVPGFVGQRAAFDAVRRAAVVVDFRAWAGGAGLPGGPVVVSLAHALDTLSRDAGVLEPQFLGFVVLFVDRHPEALGRQSVTAVVHAGGEQFEGELDGIFLEVITKGEVAAHLEERSVAGSLAYLLDVTGADALLDARGTAVGRLFAGGQVGNERHHSGHSEEK